MRLLKAAPLAAIIALGLYGVGHAGPRDSHVMLLEWPDGTVAQVRYTGDMPPAVRMPAAIQAGQNLTPALISADPFAMMQQVAEQMDHEADVLMRSVAMMAPMPEAGGPVTVAAPAGMCVQSVQVTYTGQGQPRVVSQTSGDCGPTAAPTHAIAQPGFSAPASVLHGTVPQGPSPHVTAPYGIAPYGAGPHVIEARSNVRPPSSRSAGPIRLAENTVQSAFAQ